MSDKIALAEKIVKERLDLMKKLGFEENTLAEKTNQERLEYLKLKRIYKYTYGYFKNDDPNGNLRDEHKEEFFVKEHIQICRRYNQPYQSPISSEEIKLWLKEVSNFWTEKGFKCFSRISSFDKRAYVNVWLPKA